MKSTNTIRRIAFALALICICFTMMTSMTAYATEEKGERYYFSSLPVNAGNKDGYKERDTITENDIHYGWEIGQFYMEGHTATTHDANGNVIFLKNVGDTVTLNFDLLWDISCLNGDEQLSVNGQKDGFDEELQSAETEFGTGALYIVQTDCQNKTEAKPLHTNFLSKFDDEVVKVFEEGDYLVVLDYQIRKDNFDIWGWKPFPSYYNYRIEFRFSVRNGNSMFFANDVETGDNLYHKSWTANGFRLNLGGSKYLKLNVKKEVLEEGLGGLVEDVKFNKPAKDGSVFTDEGIYTITVTNVYTNQSTTKVIYVGDDDIIKAYLATGMSIDDIRDLVSRGATINPNGTLDMSSIPNDDGIDVVEDVFIDETPADITTTEDMQNTDGDTSDTVDRLSSWGIALFQGFAGLALLLKKKFF